MFRFVARWLADTLQLALPLAFAIVAMQLPAFTNEYTAALLQVTSDAQRDIDQRETAARSYYNLPSGTDDQLIEGLRTREPSNAESLSRSIAHGRELKAAWARITAAPPLLQPPTALMDAFNDPDGSKREILRTAWQTHVTQIAFSTAAAIYGLIGILVGALLARIVVAVLSTSRSRAARA